MDVKYRRKLIAFEQFSGFNNSFIGKNSAKIYTGTKV